MTETIELREWTKPGTSQVRRYVRNWPALIGLEVSHYNTGNISGARLDGEHISNAEAGRILAAKVWLDAEDAVHVDGLRARWLDADDIASAVTRAYDAAVQGVQA